MNYYMVYGSTKTASYSGKTFLHWEPVAVFSGDTPEDACKAAAKETNNFGTFFAVEGFAWGIELMESDAGRLGTQKSVDERIADRLDRMDELDAQARQLLEAKAAKGEGEAAVSQ